MKVHVIQQEPIEALCAYEIWAKKKNYDVEYTRLWDNDKLPEGAEGIDMLVILGGPQCPATTDEECPFFNAKGQKELIKKCVDAGKMVIGVCLGAQLVGEALGAEYGHSPEREVGSITLKLTEEGKKDPFIGKLPETFVSGAWHNDMPGLTAEAKILATSEGCERQIIRYGKFVYGMQAHMEFNKEVVSGMLRNNPGAVADAGIKRFVWTKEKMLEFDYSEMNANLEKFLDAMSEEFINAK